jgi:hypothetical protein
MNLTLTTPFPIMAISLSAVAVAVLLRMAWAERSARDWPELLLSGAVCLLPDEYGDWGIAMMAELAQIQSRASRWRFTLGCARVALFPPRRSNLRVAVVGLASAAAAVATGLASLPALRDFAVTFVALVGGFATLAVARSRRPSPVAPGVVVTASLLAGVAGCIAIFAYVAVKFPPAVRDPSHALSTLFAVFLTGYVWLALTPPRALTTSRFARRLGVGAALVYGLVFGLGQVAIDALFDADAGDAVGLFLLLVVPVVLVLACSIVAAATDRSLRAGIEAAMWGGLVIALAIFNLRLLTLLLGFQHDAVLADSYRPGFTPEFATWFPRLLGDELAGGIVSLVLVPGWLLFFGLIGARVGRAMRGAPSVAAASTRGYGVT